MPSPAWPGACDNDGAIRKVFAATTEDLEALPRPGGSKSIRSELPRRSHEHAGNSEQHLGSPRPPGCKRLIRRLPHPRSCLLSSRSPSGPLGNHLAGRSKLAIFFPAPCPELMSPLIEECLE